MAQDGEFALIARIAHHLTGAGDDAAVLDLGGAPVVVAADAVVRGRHWLDALSSPDDVGWKALAVNLSDLAAMGDVRPRAALVTLLLSADLDAAYVDGLYEGLAEAAAAAGVELVGGDTTAAPEAALAVTILGQSRAEPVWRSGARAGDRMVLVGGLGAAAAALAQHGAGLAPDAALLDAHRRPVPLGAAGAALAAHGARALIDISDGLGQDAAHVCRASGVRAVLAWDRLPLAAGVAEAADSLGADPVALACGGGEDYALLAAVPAERAEEAAAAAARTQGVPAAVVGDWVEASPGAPIVELLHDGARRDIAALGFDHFDHFGEQR